jgi:hypothetical protein
MKQPDVCLTLVAAIEIQEMIIDVLLEHEDIVRRFVTQPLDAHGARIGYTSVAERVRGRAGRVQFQLLLAREDSERMLDTLREHLPRAEITYWITPLLAYGRLQ